MDMKFQELIPASDRLGDELLEVKGGTAPSGVLCGRGTVCDVGRTGPEIDPKPEEPSPGPSLPGPVIPTPVEPVEPEPIAPPKN